MQSNSLFGSALAHPQLWITLAWNEVVQSYRRTVLGPFWITVNMAIFALAMTLVYSAIFGVQPREYSSYVVCSMVVWWWIIGILTESGSTFLSYGQFIRGMPCEKATFVWAAAFKQVIIFGHNAIVYVALIAIGFIKPTFNTLLLVPAMAFLFVLSIPLIGILSILYVRYRDLHRLVGGAIVILMMVTPVFWKPEMLTGWRTNLVALNPLYYVIEFMRKPLLGQPIPLNMLLSVVAITAVAWFLGSRFFRRYSPYVVFWL